MPHNNKEAPADLDASSAGRCEGTLRDNNFEPGCASACTRARENSASWSRRNDGSNLSPTEMGSSSSVDRAIACCKDSSNQTRRRIQGKTSSESGSSDEDHVAREIDIKGRIAASDADLINVQRNEKTDVNAGLEDRWLRSHFSGVDINASEAENNRLLDRKSFIVESEKSVSTKELKLKASHDRVTVTSESVDYSAQGAPKDYRQRLSILHFNDVYELKESKKEPVGGAARFAELFKQVSQKAKNECNGEEPLIIFSGDCLNPSILSSATKGRHMVDVLNQLKVTAAVFGNHEFDFGVDHVISCIKGMHFPWFLSNVLEKCNGKPLGDGVIRQVIPWNGLQIGIMGLIEEEWLETLTTVDKSELVFQNYVTRGNELAQELKDDGAELIIALTHMRWPNDIRLAKEVKDVDIILGGHDHEYGVKIVDDCVIVKSGCDFQTFSLVDLYLKHSGGLDVSITRYDVTSSVQENVEMLEIVDKYVNVLEEQLEQTIGLIKAPLDGIYKHVRSRETNLGNFVADIMRMTTRADVVMINSGTFRSNAVHDAGKFKVRDLMRILPIHDNVVVLEVTGQQLLDGLENAVSKYPRHEGRFAQISGFCFGFDPKAAPGNRVVQESIKIHGKPIDLKKIYILATKAYVARGRDGYECFASCRLFNDPDSGPILSTIVRNHISNVAQLLRRESNTGDKLRVIEGGKKIISTDGDPHEVFSACFEDAPAYKLQKSMEEIMPKDLDTDINGNRKRRDSELSKKRDFVDDTDDDGLCEGRAMHMQHLIEIDCGGQIFDKTPKTNCRITTAKKKAVEADKENLNLLEERQNSCEDVRWQVMPLVEGRIFHCPKK